ncbi:class I SAM-dependent methyltransferase [Algoriphagus sp. C2-6-M1]|uniref:class I SAM-dependent methyltransferase n=1 Tax=Algoriphagus persicinus TaxID=3108754 RepID=UPI002B39BD99|nr:class I SAM-dependent methyltransferase [Algoriphagus sp. C2-6-M1]MEB2782532.1 class I SAM-dependent methyltransferase [Algoriphagus sp. C2-6-M1]
MNNCEVCGSTQLMSFQAKERMFGLNNTFEYLECGQCKGLFLINIPDNLGEYYPDKYYSFDSYQPSKGILRALKRARFKLYQAGLSLRPPNYFNWIYNLNVNETSRIADVGCGNGQLLAELSYCGFKNLHGYDPFLTLLDDSKGFQLIKKDFFQIDQKYDLVMFHHSFEHIPHPSELFKKLVQILNPGGEVLIRVPVTDGKVWLEEREFWFQLDAPRHIFIPNTQSMHILAEKFNLELFKIEFDSLYSQFWGTELYKRGKSFVGTAIEEEFTKEELDRFKAKAKDYNEQHIGDQACFYFRKK